MPVTVIYRGDGEVGEAVVYGLPFIVGERVTLPEGFPWAHKIIGNGTFEVVADAAPVTAGDMPKPRRGRPPRAR
jgi:hypothetical protein